MIVPQPNAIASHGTSRPGATSAVAHSRTRCAARRAKSLRLCGQASAGLRPAAIQGRQASARPRDLLCSTIARPPDARATSHRRILHNAAALDTVLGGRPQRSWSMERRAMPKSRPACFAHHPSRASLAGLRRLIAGARLWSDRQRDGSCARSAARCRTFPDCAALDPHYARYTEANMDQGVQLKRTDRIRAVERVRNFIVRAVDGARAVEAPFYHLQLEQVFPDDVYASMLTAMQEASDYRPLYGQNQCNVL